MRKKPNECQDSLESVPCGVDTGRDNHTQPQTVIEELKQRVTDANKRKSDEPCPIRVLAEATIKLGPTTIHDRYLRELIPSFHILRRGIRRYSWNRRLHLLVEVIASPHVGSKFLGSHRLNPSRSSPVRFVQQLLNENFRHNLFTLFKFIHPNREGRAFSDVLLSLESWRYVDFAREFVDIEVCRAISRGNMNPNSVKHSLTPRPIERWIRDLWHTQKEPRFSSA